MGVTSNAGGVKPGIIVPFAGAVEPAGWLLCYGQAVSRATYAALFSAIGTTHGVGDGATTFNVPDLRGRTVAGKDNMGGTAANRLTAGGSGVTGTTLGAVGGTETHTLTAAQSGLPSHTHSVGVTASSSGVAPIGQAGPDSAAGNTGSAGGTSASSAHQNVQPTQIHNYIIKA